MFEIIDAEVKNRYTDVLSCIRGEEFRDVWVFRACQDHDFIKCGEILSSAKTFEEFESFCRGNGDDHLAHTF